LANFTGGKIEAADYDLLAFRVNDIFSDTSNGSGGPANLVFSTSDLLLQTVVASTGSGQVFTTVEPIPNSYYIIVTADSETVRNSNVSIDSANNTITISTELTAGTVIRVYDRLRHILGWGQEPASVYPHPTYPDDSIEISRVLESNINNLIDKVNIMADRVGSNVELTRIAKGGKIYPTFASAADDINTINTVIQNYVWPNRWANEVATTTESVESTIRTDPWANRLVTTFRWSWPTYNNARYFFNTGCELRTSVSMTGDPGDAGYANWSRVVNQMGSLVFDYNTTSQTGSGGIKQNWVGFYGLTDQFQPIFTSAPPDLGYINDVGSEGEYNTGEYPSEYGDPGAFDDLYLRFDARYVEDAGTHNVEIRITMDDTSYDQDIAGTTTFHAGYKLADDITNNSASFTMPAPTITVINSPNSGDDS
jgi:hypothetical protein